MIIVEINNREIKAIQLSKKVKTKEVVGSRSVEAIGVIADLSTGINDYTRDTLRELLNKLTLNYENESYAVVINSDEAITQKVEIPKVRDKEISLAVNSALMSEQIPISADSIVAQLILKKDDKTKYSIVSQVLNKKIIDSIVDIFSTLGLKLKHIDITPNTIIKSYLKSNLIERESSLDLIVDVTPEGMQLHQFVEGEYKFSYVEKVKHSNHDQYHEYLESNVQQFLDEYADYTFADLTVSLMGTDSIIKELMEKFPNIENFTDTLDFYENFSMDSMANYVNLLGASIRMDQYLSSNSKYDVNLLDKKQVKQQKNSEDFKKYFIGAGVASALGVAFLIIMVIGNSSIKKSNAKIEEFINDPAIKEKIVYSDSIVAKNVTYDSILEELRYTKTFLSDEQQPYTSAIHDVLYQYVTVGSNIKSISYGENMIKVDYVAANETAFMNYTQRLKSSGYFKNVNYSAYSLDKDNNYSGVIAMTIGEGKQ